ncbi:MAG: NAD-dependent succinate-semialdehyde dehydrogenase [Bacteroidota bacterium]
MFATINPVNEQLIESFDSLSDKEIEIVLSQANLAFKQWRDVSVDERIKSILAIGEDLRNNKTQYALTITLEMGKPLTQAIAEVEKCAKLCDYYAQYAPSILNNKNIATEFTKSYVQHAPMGTIMGIMPWNFPFWQGIRFSIPALLAGNSILLKPAPNVPKSAKIVESIVNKHCMVPNVFQTILIEVGQVEKILSHRIVKGVALTGSDRAGSAVATIAGKHIKKSILELGGSDAFVVLKDADLEKAAETGLKSRMNNTGQTCISAKRFILDANIADDFTDLLLNKIQQLQIGDPLQAETNLSSLARPDLNDLLDTQVQKSIGLGAQAILEGGPMDRPGSYYSPTVLTNINPHMPAFHEELFGPVVSIFRVKNEVEALRLANDTIYGLGASIWSKDLDRAERLAWQIDTGIVAINDMVKSDPRMPFGGVKRSGYGRELGTEGLLEFVNVKSIVAR